MGDPIIIPRSRQHRLLKLLNLTPDDGVLEILLTPEGGLVTLLKQDALGEFIGPDVTETHEIFYEDRPDPLASGPEYRMHNG